MAKHRTYSIEFKRQVAQEYLGGETLHGLARRHDVSRNLIRIWVSKLEAGAFDEDVEAAGVIVCDRYSAYKRLARLREGKVTLAFCWSHMRRDFVECAAGQVRLTDWCQGWIERIASIYRLNEARLAHYDPGIERQTPAFDAAQGALKEALDGLFAQAELELAGPPDPAREGKALRSLLNHREGLSVFVDRPQVPLDNNRAERFLRGPAIGRRLSFGSDSEDGARFTAIMYLPRATPSSDGHGNCARRTSPWWSTTRGS